MGEIQSPRLFQLWPLSTVIVLMIELGVMLGVGIKWWLCCCNGYQCPGFAPLCLEILLCTAYLFERSFLKNRSPAPSHSNSFFWRIHLRTVVILTQVAAVLFWVNLTRNNYPTTLGWPLSFSKSWDERRSVTMFFFEFYPDRFAANVLANVLILAVISIAIEYFIRRGKSFRSYLNF